MAPEVVGGGKARLRRDLSLKVGRYQERKGTCHRHAGPVFSSVAQRCLQHAGTTQCTGVRHPSPFGCRRCRLGVFDHRPVANRLSRLNAIRATGLSSSTWGCTVWAIHRTLVINRHLGTGCGHRFALCCSGEPLEGRGARSGRPLTSCPLHTTTRGPGFCQTVLCTARSGCFWDVVHRALSDGILRFKTQTLQLAKHLRKGGSLLGLFLPGGPHQLVHVTGAALG